MTRKSRAASTMPSAGTRLPAASSTTSPGTSVARRHGLQRAVAQHARGEGEPLPQRGDRRRGAVFLGKAQRDAAEHDRQDDRGVEPVAQDQRDRGADDEDQDQRTRELVAEQQPHRVLGLLVETVGAVALEPQRPPRRRQGPARTRPAPRRSLQRVRSSTQSGRRRWPSRQPLPGARAPVPRRVGPSRAARAASALAPG